MLTHLNMILLIITILIQAAVKSCNSLSFAIQFSKPDPYHFSPLKTPLPCNFKPPRGIRAAYWPSFDDFHPSSINTKYFTHIFYAFILPKHTTYKLLVTRYHQKTISVFTDSLRTRNPPVKILLSIGGGAGDPSLFSAMARTRQTRRAFINSTIEVARNYGFDGVDSDWEFPADEKDMSNLATLLKQWSKSLTKEASITKKPRLLLTSAVYYAPRFITYGKPRAYPAKAMAKYLDWLSPMCFDYHGSWENFTGVNAALYDPNSDISTYFGIRSWVKAGMPPEKIVMGLPLYGRTWKLRDPNVNGIGAPAVGVGPGDGFLDYSEIIDLNGKINATVKFHEQSISHYSYAGDSWVGYDDGRSVRRKVWFARMNGLLGYFFWALGQDKDWIISRHASIAWMSHWF